jgi:hypothetical protein
VALFKKEMLYSDDQLMPRFINPALSKFYLEIDTMNQVKLVVG